MSRSLRCERDHWPPIDRPRGVRAGIGLSTASPPSRHTVAQRDGFRSARAPRTADVSADGRSVAFESLARLVPPTPTTGPTSTSSIGRPAASRSRASGPWRRRQRVTFPRISGDGRYVVFEWRQAESHATPRADIVLRDRVTGTTRVLTATPRNSRLYGWSRAPDISDDGRVVAFSSAATTLTDGPDVNGALEDIYLVRLPAGTISRVSVTSAGVQPDVGDSILPSLSADGRWLAFASTAPLDDRLRRRFGAASEQPHDRTARNRPAGVSARRDRRSHDARHARAESRHSQRRQLASLDQRRRAIRGVRVGRVEPPRGDDNRAADVLLYDRETDALSWVSRAADG